MDYPFTRVFHGLSLFASQWMGRRDGESTLMSDAQSYWTSPSDASFALNAHIRGSGGLSETTFAALGQYHVELFKRFNRMIGLPVPLRRIVEWGCGGGSNAVPFAGLCDEFIGVDVSREALERCDQVVRESGHAPIVSVQVQVAEPERALPEIPRPCDLFLCTYVFELIPSPEYGHRLLRVARECLRPGGAAMVQIKYTTGSWRTRARRWGYRRNLANMTSYRIDEFWELAAQSGLPPLAVHLLPREPLVHDGRYAYFFLQREP